MDMQCSISFPKRFFRIEAFPYWAYVFILLAYIFRDLPVYHGQLPADPDNYTRATQILEFLKHGHWFDTNIARFEPPGIDVYSRLVDLPYALVAELFAPFVGLRNAVFVAVCLVPPLVLLPLYLWLGVWASEPFVGPRWSRLAPLPAVCWGTAIFYFQPGLCDHHNIQILILLAMLGTLARAIMGDAAQSPKKWGALFALLAALSVQIGLEGMPFIAFFLGAFATFVLWTATRRYDSFLTTVALSFPALTFLMLIATRAPETYFDMTLFRISALTVLIAFGAGVSAFAALAIKNLALPAYARIAVWCLFVLALGESLLAFEPRLAEGSWIGLAPALREFAVAHTKELLPAAQDVYAGAASFLWQSLFILSGFFFLSLDEEKDDRKWLYASFAALGVLCVAGQHFYAVRIGRFIAPFMTISLLAAARFCFRALKARPIDRRRFAFELLVLLLLGPLGPMPVVKAMANSKIADIVFFFAPVFEKKDPLLEIAAYLNRLTIDGKPIRILTGFANGSELLFLTPTIIYGTGQQYTSMKGYEANKAFYLAGNNAEAAKVLDEFNIDYVLFGENDGAHLAPALDAQREHGDVIFDQLKKNDAPKFLRLEKIIFGEYKLYAVDKVALQKAL